MVTWHQCWAITIKEIFNRKECLRRKSTTGRVAFQSNLKFTCGETRKIFDKQLTNVIVTLWNLRFFTHKTPKFGRHLKVESNKNAVKIVNI